MYTATYATFNTLVLFAMDNMILNMTWAYSKAMESTAPPPPKIAGGGRGYPAERSTSWQSG